VEKTSVPRFTPAQQCARAYEQYLREERVLAEATIVNYMPWISRFLNDRFGRGPAKLSRLGARDVVGFVQRHAPRLQPKGAKILTTALRSFLRYLRYSGEMRLDLATAVPCVANWSMPSIPRGIAPEQVCRLLRGSIAALSGRRDYAILLLLARLGCAPESDLARTRRHRLAGRMLERPWQSGQRTQLLCRRMWVMRSWLIFGTDDPVAAAVGCFCAPELRFADFCVRAR
jgi:hypothetical protein